jgi:hypothetical protein
LPAANLAPLVCVTVAPIARDRENIFRPRAGDPAATDCPSFAQVVKTSRFAAAITALLFIKTLREAVHKFFKNLCRGVVDSRK